MVSERWTGCFATLRCSCCFLLVYFLILNPVKKQVLAAFDSREVRLQPAALLRRSRVPSGSAVRVASASGRRQSSARPGARRRIRELQRALAMRQQIVSTVKADPENAGAAGPELAG